MLWLGKQEKKKRERWGEDETEKKEGGKEGGRKESGDEYEEKREREEGKKKGEKKQIWKFLIYKFYSCHISTYKLLR